MGWIAHRYTPSTANAGELVNAYHWGRMNTKHPTLQPALDRREARVLVHNPIHVVPKLHECLYLRVRRPFLSECR